MPRKSHKLQDKKNPGLNLELTDNRSTIEGEILENLRLMVARIQKSGEIPKIIAVTSAISGEGVTSVSLGLGAVLANDYQADVCVVDLNWYSPAVLLPDQDKSECIIDILEHDVSVEDALAATGIKSMKLLPAGKLEFSKRPVLARSDKLANLLVTLMGMFDHLILDIPALLSTSDAVFLANYADGCILVVQQGVTPMSVIKESLDEVSQLKVLGVVLNRAVQASPRLFVKILGS